MINAMDGSEYGEHFWMETVSANVCGCLHSYLLSAYTATLFPRISVSCRAVQQERLLLRRRRRLPLRDLPNRVSPRYGDSAQCVRLLRSGVPPPRRHAEKVTGYLYAADNSMFKFPRAGAALDCSFCCVLAVPFLCFLEFFVFWLIVYILVFTALLLDSAYTHYCVVRTRQHSSVGVYFGFTSRACQLSRPVNRRSVLRALPCIILLISA